MEVQGSWYWRSRRWSVQRVESARHHKKVAVAVLSAASGVGHAKADKTGPFFFFFTLLLNCEVAEIMAGSPQIDIKKYRLRIRKL